MKTFVCKICGGTFQCQTDEATKEEEFAVNFPGEKIDKSLSCCTECWETKVKTLLAQQPLGVIPKR